MDYEKSFEVSAWSGGSTEYASLGFRISKNDRAIFFPEQVKIIRLYLPRLEQPVIVDLSDKQGFWNKCPELMNEEIKNWLIENGHGEWAKGNPPKFILTEISQGVFNLIEE